MADKVSREEIGRLGTKVNIDVSEALTGLKAIQREAKEAAIALRKIGNAIMENRQIEKMPTTSQIYEPFVVSPLTVGDVPKHLKKYGKSKTWSKTDDDRLRAWFDCSTQELHDELVKREGVEEYIVDAHGGKARVYIENGQEGACIPIDGPARIIINKD